MPSSVNHFASKITNFPDLMSGNTKHTSVATSAVIESTRKRLQQDSRYVSEGVAASIKSHNVDPRLTLDGILRDKSYGESQCQQFMGSGVALISTSDREESHAVVESLVKSVCTIEHPWMTHEYTNAYDDERFTYF